MRQFYPERRRAFPEKRQAGYSRSLRNLDMRRISLVLAAVLALCALMGVFVLAADAAGVDGDDAPIALAASTATPPPGPATIGGLHVYIPSIVERHFESSPLCRGRPRRASRTMNLSSTFLASERFFADRPSLGLSAGPESRRFSPHPRP